MLLARMAEAVYWAGRYLERAEDTARIVQVHGETPHRPPRGRGRGLGAAGRDRRDHGRLSRAQQPAGLGASRPPSKRSVEARVVAYVLTDRDNPVLDPGVDRGCP